MDIKVRRIGLEQASLVQKIYEASPAYFHRVENSEVLPGLAEKDLIDCPPPEKQNPNYQKIFCLLLLDDQPVGIVDLHENHPAFGTVYIGLFLLEERFHSRGIGRACYKATEHFMRKDLKVERIKLGVSEENDVEGFWSKMGFSRNGHTYLWQGANRKNQVFEMEKSI